MTVVSGGGRCDLPVKLISLLVSVAEERVYQAARRAVNQGASRCTEGRMKSSLPAFSGVATRIVKTVEGERGKNWESS